jgi:phosphoglycolate phosphatase-like HAD superfamily hydrolase
MQQAKTDPEIRNRFQTARCVLFDCDGILFDSNGFKVAGMRHALADEPQPLVAEMEAYWRGSGGVSRWAKFRYYYEQISPCAEVDRAVERACQRFGDYSLAAYDSQDPVPAALTAARAVGAKRAVVVSGASQTELETVFTKKDIAALFSEILGSPTPKQDLVRAVLSARNLAASEVLFIGDGAGDLRVARELDVPFVYLNQFSEWPGARDALGNEANVTWADDWSELLTAFGLDA